MTESEVFRLRVRSGVKLVGRLGWGGVPGSDSDAHRMKLCCIGERENREKKMINLYLVIIILITSTMLMNLKKLEQEMVWRVQLSAEPRLASLNAFNPEYMDLSCSVCPQ